MMDSPSAHLTWPRGVAGKLNFIVMATVINTHTYTHIGNGVVPYTHTQKNGVTLICIHAFPVAICMCALQWQIMHNYSHIYNASSDLKANGVNQSVDH